MSNVRLVPTSIDIVYEEVGGNTDKFEREFDQISENEENSVGQMIKHAKMRGDADESTILMLNVMAELYRKMEKIEQLLSNGASKYLQLSSEALIKHIGLEHFKLSAECLEVGTNYYGRIEIGTFPKREIAFFFEAVEPSLAKIKNIHLRDREAWEYYMMACERAMIRQMKGLE